MTGFGRFCAFVVLSVPTAVAWGDANRLTYLDEFCDVEARRWIRLDWTLPAGATIVDARGRDAGLRLVDVNGDGRDDLLFSDDERYSLHLFTSIESGWSRTVVEGRRGEEDAAQEATGVDSREIPRIVSGGTNFGAWFHSGHMWVQNEYTNRLPDLVRRVSYEKLLGEKEN